MRLVFLMRKIVFPGYAGRGWYFSPFFVVVVVVVPFVVDVKKASYAGFVTFLFSTMCYVIHTLTVLYKCGCRGRLVILLY